MITNLLNQDVIYQDHEYKICAVYEMHPYVLLGLVNEQGEMLFDIRPSSVRINNNRIYMVYMYYHINKKIMAIKATREITGAGLREAKDLVEAHPEGVKLKKHLTHSEAREVRKIIEANGLEGQIMKE